MWFPPDPETRLSAEQEGCRRPLAAVEAVTRFGARLPRMPAGVAERTAPQSVSAALRAEGVWLGPEKTALCRAPRLAGADEAQDPEADRPVGVELNALCEVPRCSSFWWYQLLCPMSLVRRDPIFIRWA